MKNIIGLKGGSDATFFEVLDVKETTVKIYPSIKDGKVMSALEVGLSQDFFKYKKEIAIPGHYAVVAGNAVCAADGILDVLEGVPLDVRNSGQFAAKYKAIAVNPNCVEIYAVADYNEQVERVCHG
jgi:hypothetical protein